MSKIKLVVEEVNSTTGVNVNTRVFHPTRSTVTNNGTRASDVGEFTLPITAKIGQNDIVSYIQDVVNTESLVSIYNFKHSSRDEGGFDIDGDDRNSTSDYLKDLTNGRFDQHYYLNFDAAGEEITIPHDERHDFTGSFDIYIHYRGDTNPFIGSVQNNIQCMFSKYDTGAGGNGVQVGLKYDSVNGWDVWARVRQAGTATEFWGSDSNDFGVANSPKLIRFTRDNNDLCKLYLEDKLVASGTVSGTLDAAATASILGSDNGGTLDFDGRLYQLRIYNSSLTDDQHQQIMNAKPQWSTMKIRGRVWKIKEATSHKVISIRSVNQVLFKTLLNKVIMDASAPSFGELTASRNLNIFKSTENTENIMHDILAKVDENILFASGGGGGGVNVSQYLATGTLLKNIEILTTLNGNSFWLNARQVLITEDPQTSTLIYENSIGYKITSSGKDDSTTVNDLEVTGLNPLKSELEVTGAGVTTYNTTYSPLNVKIKVVKKGTITTFADYGATVTGTVKCTDTGHGLITGDEIFIRDSINYTGVFEVQEIDVNEFYIFVPWVAADSASNYTVKNDRALIEGTDFNVDIDDKLITFTPALLGVVETAVISYDYEDPATVISRKEGGNIAGIGRFPRKLNLVQLPNITDLNAFTTAFVSNAEIGRETINERIRIEAPLLINSVRENIQPTVINNIKGINATPKISSITYKYPENRTIIEAGEHLFDSFDLQKRLVENDESSADVVLKTKNV